MGFCIGSVSNIYYQTVSYHRYACMNASARTHTHTHTHTLYCLHINFNLLQL